MITDSLNVNFPKYYQFSGYVCLDESTEVCRARLSYVQFNPVKPIKRGLKIFSLCDSKSSEYVTFFSLNRTLVNATQLSVGMGYTLM